MFYTVDCGELSDPLNGSVSQTGRAAGDNATYTCRQGYNLIGENFRTCSQLGEWMEEAPICQSMLKSLLEY